MPILLDEAERPERMHQGDRGEDYFGDQTELLFRRCPAEYIKESGVDEAAVKEHNLSVLRSHFAEPDDARWDSRVWCEANGRVPQVYPEQYVIEIPVAAVPAQKEVRMADAAVYRFRTIHVPQRDNYAHSEIRIFKGEKWVRRSGDLKSVEAKKARKYLQAVLAEAARVRLRPYEASRFEPDQP